MNFCAHGNIDITCPQCKGRSAGAGFASPAPVAPPPVDDRRRTLDLGSVIDRAVDRVTATSDRQAAGVKAFWSQINRPTTIAEHQSEHEPDA